VDEIWNISEGALCALMQEKCAKSPQGFRSRVLKRVLFFALKATRPFGHLSCTDFDHFWNNRRESFCACVHRWKISEFLRREFSRSQNSPKYGTL